MQEGEDPRYLRVVATCKHFAAYSLEKWNGTTRDYFNAVVGDADLVEYYLAPFQACVQEARAAGIMCR
jgi:xylan 1,4-beta-xylosidase